MKTFKIPAQLKADWIAALRSGEYKQCKETLVRGLDDGHPAPPRFCCLGVLQMVADGQIEKPSLGGSLNLPTVGWYKSHGIEPNLGLDSPSSRSFSQLTEDDQFSIHGSCPIGDDTGSVQSLSYINDELDYDFNSIADIIEQSAEAY